MKTKWIHLLTLGLTVTSTAATVASPPLPMVVNTLSGSLHVQQGLPCGQLTETTPVTAGRIELTPAGGHDVPGGKRFTLTRANVLFAPFELSATCYGFSETRTYQEVGVQVVRAASFVGTPSSPGVYTVTIPKEEVLIYEAAIANGLLEQGYKHPKHDVTGTINLQNRTVQMQVVVGTRVHFKAGCVDFCGPFADCEACVIDEHKDGTLTASLSGTLVFPDSDGDGIPDPDDLCPMFANRDQQPVPPQVRPPLDATVASCVVARLGPALGIDVCHDLPVQVTDDAPDVFRPGANVVTYTAVDAQGYTASARQAVTVRDATPPVFSSLPADLRLDNCGPARLDPPTMEDDCGGTPAVGHDAPRAFPLGRTPVTWTATDASGNRATATQVVEVEDAAAPAVTCASAGTGLYLVGASDACSGSPEISLGPYLLISGSTIGIAETAKPGVRLLGVGKDGIVRYEVGPGEAVIAARDGAGNVGTARCR
jgi:hypothetical protein